MSEVERVRARVAARGIQEVMHFTTNLGLLGILSTGYLKARALLETDQYLEFIFTPNAHIRRDRAWSGHANLSLSRVNPSFFSISRKWHELENVWWCILSFDPEILTHEGVVFVTTNNIWTGVRRGKGADALEALFAASIYRYATKPPAVRAPECPANYTTCEEAEVLYPQQVTTSWLRRIYFFQQNHLWTGAGQLATVANEIRDQVEVVLAPEMFSQ